MCFSNTRYTGLGDPDEFTNQILKTCWPEF